MAPAIGASVVPLTPVYHWIPIGVDVLDGAIVSGVVRPCTIVMPADCVSIDTKGQPFTVTVAVCESAGGVQALLTRTQNVVVDPTWSEMALVLAPATGCDVFPLLPMYHWYCSGASPVAATNSEAVPPLAI